MTQRALPDSLWAATAIAAPETPPLAGKSTADVAVIGGGYAGISAALHLAEAGVNVVLLEAAEPGWGASGRNGGQVVPGFKAPPADILAKFGKERGQRMFAYSGGFADVVFDLIERHQIDCEASRSGLDPGSAFLKRHGNTFCVDGSLAGNRRGRRNDRQRRDRAAFGNELVLRRDA